MKIKPRLYLDTCSFIDIVKGQLSLLVDEDRKNDVWYLTQLMKAHAAGDVTLFTSFLAVAEAVAVEAGNGTVPQDVQDRFRRLLTSGQYVMLWSPTPATARTAQDLRWKHKLVLGGPDALHIATAMEARCAEFITSDDRLQKPKLAAAIITLQGIGLSAIPARKTKYLPDEYKQGDML
jgi:PIN domain.